jgi:hypothetical protein
MTVILALQEKAYHPPPPGKGKKGAQSAPGADPDAPKTELPDAGPTPESTATGLDPEEATSVQADGSAKAP